MIFKLVIFALVCYALYRLLMNDGRKNAEKEAKDKKRRLDAGELVKDPVCGTYVDRENAIRVRDGENMLYFCSYECRKKYLDGREEKREQE